MKQEQHFALRPEHEWLLSLTIDEVTRAFKLYEIEIMNMDEKDALKFIYEREKDSLKI